MTDTKPRPHRTPCRHPYCVECNRQRAAVGARVLVCSSARDYGDEFTGDDGLGTLPRLFTGVRAMKAAFPAVEFCPGYHDRGSDIYYYVGTYTTEQARDIAAKANATVDGEPRISCDRWLVMRAVWTKIEGPLQQFLQTEEATAEEIFSGGWMFLFAAGMVEFEASAGYKCVTCDRAFFFDTTLRVAEHIKEDIESVMADARDHLVTAHPDELKAAHKRLYTVRTP